MKKHKYTRKNFEYNIKFPNVDLYKVFLVLTTLTLGYFFVTNAIVKYMILKKQFDILEKHFAKLKEENERLSKEINLLKNDKDTIEYYIRKELRYKKPEEKVLIIDTKK